MAAQSTKKNQTRTTYHRGNVREDLIEVARKILEEEGVPALTLRRLTREIGVTPANFYNHFQTLDFLLAELAKEGFRLLAVRNAAVIAKVGEAKKRFKALSREYVYFATDHPNVYRLMFGTLNNFSQYPGLKEASDNAYRTSVIMVYGEDRYDSEDVLKSYKSLPYAFTGWALLHGITQVILDQQIPFKTGSRKEIGAFVDVAMEAYFNGLAPILEN